MSRLPLVRHRLRGSSIDDLGPDLTWYLLQCGFSPPFTDPAAELSRPGLTPLQDHWPIRTRLSLGALAHWLVFDRSNDWPVFHLSTGGTGRVKVNVDP